MVREGATAVMVHEGIHARVCAVHLLLLVPVISAVIVHVPVADGVPLKSAVTFLEL
jgi:hypothetical protein